MKTVLELDSALEKVPVDVAKKLAEMLSHMNVPKSSIGIEFSGACKGGLITTPIIRHKIKKLGKDGTLLLHDCKISNDPKTHRTVRLNKFVFAFLGARNKVYLIVMIFKTTIENDDYNQDLNQQVLNICYCYFKNLMQSIDFSHYSKDGICTFKFDDNIKPNFEYELSWSGLKKFCDDKKAEEEMKHEA